MSETELAVLRARLTERERAQDRRRLGSWAALVGVVALAGGTAWSASGNCPNGMRYCFTADAPAIAEELNYNFSQLREQGSAWVSHPANSIPTTQMRSVVTSVCRQLCRVGEALRHLELDGGEPQHAVLPLL